MDRVLQQNPDPGLLPSLAIECIFGHYVEMGAQAQNTLWGAQEWLAQQSPLRGSPEFCRVARHKDKHMTPRVTGMRVYPWPGVGRAPKNASLTLVTGAHRMSGTTTCALALAREYSDAALDWCMLKLETFVGDACQQHNSMVREWVWTHFTKTVLPHMPYDQEMPWLSAFSHHLPDKQSNLIQTIVGAGQLVRLIANAHFLLAVKVSKEIADPRLSFAVDRIAIAAGFRGWSERARLAQYIAEMLSVDQETMGAFLATLPNYAQVILERRPGCARNEPLCRDNTIILVREPLTYDALMSLYGDDALSL